MSDFAKNIFKYRSYTPIPFVIVMLVFENANIWGLVFGFAIALCGELIRLWGVSWAGSETRTTGDVGGTYLIVSGPFSYVRNPLYVGNILMYLGIGFMSFALFPYLQIIALAFFLFQYSTIVKEEEGYLKKTFGLDYETYSKNVRRFLPRLSAYKELNITQPKFNLSRGLKSERRTLQAFSIVILTILIKWIIRTRIDSIL
jgi:protein-S-isoprenylcysteine O-methyltransferase Ste14